jgi:hypothetical protein
MLSLSPIHAISVRTLAFWASIGPIIHCVLNSLVPGLPSPQTVIAHEEGGALAARNSTLSKIARRVRQQGGACGWGRFVLTWARLSSLLFGFTGYEGVNDDGQQMEAQEGSGDTAGTNDNDKAESCHHQKRDGRPHNFNCCLCELRFHRVPLLKVRVPFLIGFDGVTRVSARS